VLVVLIHQLITDRTVVVTWGNTTKEVRVSRETPQGGTELSAVSKVPKCHMRNITTSTTINIFTDSQAAIKSLNSMTIRSKTVRDCLTALTEVANYFQIKIAWVPGHSDIPGNCKADELARAGTHLQNRSIRENLNIPFATCRLLIDKWADDMFQEKWDNVGSCRVAKLTWPTINRNRTKQLLELPRSRISLTVGVLTGHCLIGSHAARLRVPVSDFCRSCRDEEEEESPQHLLLNCPALARLRFKHMGSYFFNSLSELAEISAASVSNFVRSTKWFDTYIGVHPPSSGITTGQFWPMCALFGRPFNLT